MAPSPSKTFCEFFAGIGLVRAGLERSGWHCVYANDICQKKRSAYESRFGSSEEFHLGDVAAVDEVTARIEDRPFLATASFPCIDLSLAGNYRGFSGLHSSTFFSFAEVLHRLGRRRPKLVMIENVVGFLSARNGKDFRSAAETLAELGYWLDAFVVDARRFVPQSRPRVFILGIVPSLRPRSVRGPCDGLVLSSWCRPERIVNFMNGLQLRTGWSPLPFPEPPASTRRLSEFIDNDDSQLWWGQDEVDRHHRMMSDLHHRRIKLLLSSGRTWIGTAFRRVRKGEQRTEVRFDGLAGCLRTPSGGSGRQIVVVTADGRLKMRWMSPREYARLQGAPDFPLVGNHIQQLWGFADAVCVPVISWIDRCLLTPLFESSGNGHGGQSLAREPAQSNGCR